MGLSDACWEFNRQRPYITRRKIEAAKELLKQAKWYDQPPFDYGELLTRIQKACEAFIKDPNAYDWDSLVLAAQEVQCELDKIPPELPKDEP